MFAIRVVPVSTRRAASASATSNEQSAPKPGYRTICTRGWARSFSTIASAVAVWRARRTSSVSRPRSSSQAVSGRGDRAGPATELEKPRSRLVVPGDDRADERVVVSREVLRRRVEREIAAALERLAPRAVSPRSSRRGRARRARQPRGSRASSGTGSTALRARRDRLRRAARRSGRTRRAVRPSVRARPTERRCRSTRPPRAPRSVRAPRARGRRLSRLLRRTRTGAPARRRARRAGARPPRRSGSRSVHTRTRRARRPRTATSWSGRAGRSRSYATAILRGRGAGDSPGGDRGRNA